MINTQLILIEGLPGSGKSTIGRFISSELQKKGVKHQFYHESDIHHPTDFECEACLTTGQYQALLAKYSEKRPLIESNTQIINGNYHFHYELMLERYPDLDVNLYRELATYDIADRLPAERYAELSLERWREFSKNQLELTVLESSFLQIPVNNLLFGDIQRDIIKQQIHQLAEMLRPQNPVLIYFHQADTSHAIRKACEVKGERWEKRVMEFICNTKYGRGRQLSGIDGMISYFADRKEIELELFQELDFTKVMIDNTDYDWNRCRESVLEFLQV